MTHMLTRHGTFRLASLALATMALCALVGGVGGCRGQRSDNPPRQFLPDMDDSPKWKPQSESEFFADRRTMRNPVEGTVPFGRQSAPAHLDAIFPADFAERGDFLREDIGFYFGRDDANDFLTRMPESVTVTEDFLLYGQERFNIYCAVCHGYEGEGGYSDATRGDRPPSSAAVGKRWSIPVPSYHDPKYQDRAQRTGKDGYLFDVARYGLWDDQVNHTGNQRMPAYGHAIDAYETWAIVAYIRVLQAMRTDPASVPADLRPAESQRPAPAAEPAETEPVAAKPSTHGGETLQ